MCWKGNHPLFEAVVGGPVEGTISTQLSSGNKPTHLSIIILGPDFFFKWSRILWFWENTEGIYAVSEHPQSLGPEGISQPVWARAVKVPLFVLLHFIFKKIIHRLIVIKHLSRFLNFQLCPSSQTVRFQINNNTLKTFKGNLEPFKTCGTSFLKILNYRIYKCCCSTY